MTTYILAGYDHNGSFASEMKLWRARAKKDKDIVIIEAQAGQTMEQVASKIRPPANVLLLAHGGEYGGFDWDNGTSYLYRDLFEQLPKGVASVTVSSCYGGSALGMADSLPAGTLLQSIVSAKVQSWGGRISKRRTIETIAAGPITPLNLMLEALDSTDPAFYQQTAEATNHWIRTHPDKAEKQNQTMSNARAEDVLPAQIAIGGGAGAPLMLGLDQQMQHLAADAKQGSLNAPAWQKSIADVHAYFDPNDGNRTTFRRVLTAWVGDATGTYLGAGKTLQKKIDAIAQKLGAGEDVSQFTPEEQRYAYALTIAYLHESGTIQKWVQQQRNNEPTERPAPQSPVNDTKLEELMCTPDVMKAFGKLTQSAGEAINLSLPSRATPKASSLRPVG